MNQTIEKIYVHLPHWVKICRHTRDTHYCRDTGDTLTHNINQATPATSDPHELHTPSHTVDQATSDPHELHTHSHTVDQATSATSDPHELHTPSHTVDQATSATSDPHELHTPSPVTGRGINSMHISWRHFHRRHTDMHTTEQWRDTFWWWGFPRYAFIC